MPPGGGGQSQEPDNSMAPIWITIGIFIGCAFIWYFYKTAIIAFVFTIRDAEADLLSIFIPREWSQNLTAAQEFIRTAQRGGYSGITFENIVSVSNVVGNYLRYPISAILFVLAIVIYVSHATFRFKKTYSMNSLLSEELTNWPQVMPIAKLDLIKTDINKGPWAMAINPMPFAKKYRLLIEEKPANLSFGKNNRKITVTLNRDEARKIFAMQMGNYWVSPAALPTYARALFAIFAARINGDREGAMNLIKSINLSATGATLDFSGTDELLKKHQEHKIITKITQKHAFMLGVMASMLEAARQDGVLASADFLWLKPRDRRLWYMLNCVGRQTAFSEIAGPFAHWLAEKEIDRRLNVPMIEEAVNGLDEAIKEVIYQPDEG